MPAPPLQRRSPHSYLYPRFPEYLVSKKVLPVVTLSGVPDLDRSAVGGLDGVDHSLIPLRFASSSR